MRPIRKTFSMAAASANAICLSQKPTGAGALTINGSLAASEMDTTVWPSQSRTVANLDAYRRVAIASDADDSGVTFTVTGTDPAGAEFSETLAGPNTGAVSTRNSFVKVLSVETDGAAAGNLTVGTNASADLPWMPTPYFVAPYELALQVQFSAGASLTWQWQGSNANPYDGGRASDKPAVNEGSALTASGRQEANGAAYTMVRATITSYAGGSVDYSIVKTV